MVMTYALLLAAGAVLLGWALLHQYSAPQVPLTTPAAQTTHHVDRHARRGPAPPLGAQPSESAPPPSTGLGGVTSTPTRARTSPALVLPPSRPVSVRIPAINTHSTLLHLGLDSQGALEVPAGAHYNQAAWYTGSPTPGQPGPAVIEGHVDGTGDTASVFFKLGALKAGDEVTVTRADHRQVTFQVYRVERYHKDAFPSSIVYGNTRAPELRLITCGGDLNPQTGHHQDNTVVYARIAQTTH